MKANKENLIKAIEICAKAHNTEFIDDRNDNMIGVNSDSVPVVSDVTDIARAFFGTRSYKSNLWFAFGQSVVFLNGKFADEVDKRILSLALPKGSMRKFQNN